MPRRLVFIISLHGTPYVGPMESREGTGGCQNDGSAPSRSRSGKSERMSYWRWLLFAAMARFEVREDVYWRIPNAKAIRRHVPVEIYPKRTSGDPSDRIGQVMRVAPDDRAASMRLVSWLRRISQGRSQR